MKNDTKHSKARFSTLAIASVSLGVLGLLVLALRIPVYDSWWSEFAGRNIIGLSGIVGLILGMMAVARISKRMAGITALLILSPFLLFYSSLLTGSRLLLLFSSSAILASPLGLLVGGVVVGSMSRLRERFTGSRSIILGIVLTMFLSAFWWVETCGPMSSAAGMVCATNLINLGKAIRVYANEHGGRYPEPNQWCDLLMKHTDVQEKRFFCPGVRLRWRRQVLPWPIPKKTRCHYAMNPNCRPDSPPDIVLLFETRGGWNQFGGPEILSMDNHGGFVCHILLNDGQVRIVKPSGLKKLKWKAGENENAAGQANGSGNSRGPANGEELEYWLENMVWYHRFTNEEVSAAMGLTEKEVEAAKEKSDVWVDNRPERGKDVPLLVLPYPGGRHPRIGFLEGAIDPQRETKFSVFTPWDPKSYVVVDVPEAIWSNLGLTYLAHTHIDTIWTKQGIELAKLEWNRHPGGRLGIERELPNGIAFGVNVEPRRESVRMEMWLKNRTKQKLSDLRIQICVMPKMAAGFAEQTNENKVFRDPYAACRSSDGKRWVITAWENCHRPWGNERCPCFHSDPKFPDLEPGQMHRLRGWLSFYEGIDIEAELERIEQTNWRSAIE